jgi:serine/threonine protein kinase
MEYCKDGDLCDYLIKNNVFSESRAANLFEKIFRAVSYLHNNSIVHRDIKPDNILITGQEPELNIKITDFGLSKKFGNPF